MPIYRIVPYTVLCCLGIYVPSLTTKPTPILATPNPQLPSHSSLSPRFLICTKQNTRLTATCPGAECIYELPFLAIALCSYGKNRGTFNLRIEGGIRSPNGVRRACRSGLRV